MVEHLQGGGARRSGRFTGCGGEGESGRALGVMVAAAFGLAAEELASERRGVADVAFARQVAMYLAHTRLGLPLTAAGGLFRRDRTTARHACRQVEDRRDDPRVDRLLECLERGIDVAVDIARLHPRSRVDG
jgi:hypothetical protein